MSLVAGRYELGEELGRGGMGAVYRARDRSLQRTVAFKRLEVRSEAPQRERRRALFEREYRTLVELAHPHIVTAYDYGTDAQGPYYVMELLEGADMRELSPLPYPQACRYLREIAASLALLHARRLVHRDVTPRNVRVVGDGSCKLFDFGLLAAFGDKGDAVGTPPCIPPEALEGAPLDQRADLYALGALAYFMLTGRQAYPAGDPLQLPAYWAQPLPPPSQRMPESDRHGRALPALPRELDDLVLRLLRVDSLARPTSAGAVIDRLDVILAGEAAGELREELALAESYLASAPLVGRRRELGFAAQAVAELARGHGGVLLLEGVAGSGKTRVLREIALEARLRGATVLCVDAEALDRPYAGAHALGRQLLEVAPLEALASARAQAPLLAHVVPELADALGDVTPAPRPADPVSWRTQIQAALRGWLLDLSRRRPLLVLLDNVQRCDDPSAVLLAALALEARNHPLAVVATARSGDDAASPAALSSLRQVVRRSTLGGLSAKHLHAWVDSVFGETPNLSRLSRFLHQRTAGNPSHCMELLRLMVSRRDIRYRDGTWVLPTEPSALELPSRVEEAMCDRLQHLSGEALELAQALSLYRGGLSLEVCRKLWGEHEHDGAALCAALGELVAHEVLSAGDAGYRFRHEALRDALVGQIDDARKALLHLRVAEAILARGRLYVSERADAALHLLQAGDERGARILGEVGISQAMGKQPVAGCTRTLEAALALYREQARGPYDQAALLAPLGLAAYMVDRRLESHTDAIVACFAQVSGLGLAARMRPLLGKRLATLIGLGVGALRHACQPRQSRHCSFRELMQAFVGALLALCGKAAVCLDGPTIDRLAAVLEPLALLGKHSATKFAYDYCRGLSLVTRDRYARTYAHFLDLERRLQAPGSMSDLPQEARQLWQGGVDYVLGVFESFRGDSGALERAARLEQTGLDVHELIAAQLRLQYHGFRGETEQVRAAFEQVEARAIQTGYAWQVETWAAIAINLFGGLWNDVILTKRSLDETERLRHEIPTLDRYARSSRATYLLQRGDPRECIEVYLPVLAQEAPLQRIGWSVSSGLMAEAHNQLGEHARAREICERVLAAADPEDGAYYAFRLPVELPLCYALAGLGEHARAKAYLAELFGRYEATGSPLALGMLHEATARIAFARGDRKTFTLQLQQVERLFRPLGNPTLIARFRNLTELGGSEGGVAVSIASMRELKAFQAALAPIDERKRLARYILSWVMERHEGFVAYLFVVDASGPVVLAATSALDPRPDVVEMVRRSLASLGKGDGEDTTLCGTEAATTSDEHGSAHTYLLSYLDAGKFHGEGALVLVGRSPAPPRIRYELLQSAAQHLRRLRPTGL